MKEVIKIANLFQDDIKKSAEELGWWHRRMRDVQYYAGSSSAFDEWVSYDGKNLGLECKMLGTGKANPKSFPFKKVSIEQMEGMVEFNKQYGNKSYILINFRNLNKNKGRVFALTISNFLYLRWAFKHNENFKEEYPRNEKSIPLKYFKENILELPRLGKGWNLKCLM